MRSASRARSRRGLVLDALKRHDEALDSFDRAVAACTVEKRFIEVPKVTAPVKRRVVPMGLQGEPEGIGAAS